MAGRIASPALVALVVSMLTQPAFAQSEQDESPWRLHGSYAIGVDHVELRGDRRLSPFRFDGSHWQSTLDVNVDRTTSSGMVLRGRVELLAADSDYLADDGLVLSTAEVGIESGGTSLPYRLDLGDINASFSRRTIQRNLRGVSLELQPQIGEGFHSVAFVFGTGTPEWRALGDDADDLLFGGVSYLYSTPSGESNVVLNAVYSRGEPGVLGLVPSPVVTTEQTVLSASADSRIGPLEVEGEVAVLIDRPDPGGPEADEALGLHAQVRESDGDFTWRGRFEQNAARFIPAGGVGILADRRIGELLSTYRTRNLGWFDARVQYIQQGWDGPSPTSDTLALALAWEGLRLGAWQFSLGGEANSIESDDPALADRLFQHYRFRVARYFGRFNIEYTGHLNRIGIDGGADQNRIDHGLVLGHTTPGTLGSTSIRGGFVYRRHFRSDWDDVFQRTWNPVFDIEFSRNQHHLTAHFSYQGQRFIQEDDTERQVRLNDDLLQYAFRHGRHELTAGVDFRLRNPDGGERSEATRFRLAYRIRFDNGR